MWKLCSCTQLSNLCPELGKKTPFEVTEINQVTPECWEDIAPKFILRMRNQPPCTIEGDSDQLLELSQCLGRQLDHLVIIVHGFTGSGKNEWIDLLWQEIFDADTHQNLGILIVDWKKGAEFDWNDLNPKNLIKKGLFGTYYQAAANTRYVGIATERILRQIDHNGTIHCIGHSLGAHVCGFLGQEIKEDSEYSKKIMERITGSDPAGPNFFHSLLLQKRYDNVNSKWRLDHTDAAMVDIIHTDGDFLGTMVSVGRSDFYVGTSPSNYGTSQACCWHAMCDHSRAPLLLLESLKQPQMYLPVSKCSQLSQKALSRCIELGDPPSVGYFYNGSHPGNHGVIFSSSEVSKTVTEEDCLSGLGIVTGVTTACSKIGGYLCPFHGIGCIVSSICGGVKTLTNAVAVVTGARNACQACAKGKGTSEAWNLLHKGQEDILQQVLKANKGIAIIHTKLDNIASQLDRIELKVDYSDTIQGYQNIRRLFSKIDKDLKTGLVVKNIYLANFLLASLDPIHGLHRIRPELFEMIKGGENYLSADSIFKKVPESCEANNFRFLWNMMTECIFMDMIALSMKGREMKPRETEQVQQNLVDISEQYVKDCGCNKLGPNYAPARHNLKKLTEFDFSVSCGESLASTCSACGLGEESCGGDCTWHEGGCHISGNFEVAVDKVPSAPMREKLRAIFKIRPFSLTPAIIHFAEDISLETIQLVLQFQEERYGGWNVSMYDGRQYCARTASSEPGEPAVTPVQDRAITEIWTKTGSTCEIFWGCARSDADIIMTVCDTNGTCCTSILDNKSVDDRELGNVDKYADPEVLGDCSNTLMKGDLTARLTKGDYGNDWYVEWAKILLGVDRSLTCTFLAWIGNSNSLSKTVQCYEDLGVIEISTKTGMIVDAETDDNVSIEICDQSGNCCTASLNDPDVDDRERGNVDFHSSPQNLGSCLNTKMTGDLTATLQKEGSNEWNVEWVQIMLASGRSFTCSFKLWLFRGFSNSKSAQCTEDAGITEVWIKTGSQAKAKTNDKITIKICDSAEKCCKAILDNPAETDRMRSALDKYSNPDVLGSCFDSHLDGELSMTLQKDGSNGWYVDWAKIFLGQGTSFSCSFGLWLDNDPGYYNSNTVQCKED
eukprot:GFUD01134224.1.p1 GENE.GFUD01134224.1~~GFUD01134224.1.p1  ORF type:complete len:1144 (-),score=169.25 GFUD01134224.1:293-3652(-)